MKYTKYFLKTSKENPSAATLSSHKLLLKGGFIAESVAGRYYYLPLGWRVHEKIKQIIKKKMDAAGALEMITPTLHPLEFWAETNRTSTTGFELMNIKDRRGAEFALGGTAEEMFVDLVRKANYSYRDLPFNIYQFSTKFRDELRARGGLLRVREFVMKDAYSFHANEADFKITYEKMAEVYYEIFAEMGLTSERVLADNGYIGGEYCHEFQVECSAGEGKYFVSEDGKYIAHEDVAEFDRELINPNDEIKPMQVSEQPEWVKTMEDNQKHYNLPASRFLKNVVYKNITTGELIIVVIRGDLGVNKTKVESKLSLVGQLEEASDQDLKSIGTKSGWVHSWGHKARYVGDLSLKTVKNFIGGYKEKTTDTSNVNYGRDFECEVLDDFAVAENGHTKDGQKLIAKTGIEVGNIFQLGTHYTEKMKGAEFIDRDGKAKPYYMGCYGIGLGRTLATIVEKYHDEKGIIWPKSVAPFQVYLSAIGKNDQVYKKAEEIYENLKTQEVEVFYDDRREKKIGPGVKFGDFELLGIPHQIVISEKLLEAGNVELWDRATGERKEIPIEALNKDLLV